MDRQKYRHERTLPIGWIVPHKGLLLKVLAKYEGKSCWLFTLQGHTERGFILERNVTL